MKKNNISLFISKLKSLNNNNNELETIITNEIINKIKDQIEPKMYEKILNDTQTTTVWVYEIIKQICKDNINE